MLPGKYLVKNCQRNKSNKDFQVLLKMKKIILIPASWNPTPYTFKDFTNAERSELALKSKGPEAAEKRRRGDYPTFLKCVTLLGHFWVRRHW